MSTGQRRKSSRLHLLFPLAIALGASFAVLQPAHKSARLPPPSAAKPAQTPVANDALLAQPVASLQPIAHVPRPPIENPSDATVSFNEVQEGHYEASTSRYVAKLSASEGLRYRPLLGPLTTKPAPGSAEPKPPELRVRLESVLRGNTVLFSGNADADADDLVGEEHLVAFWRATGFEERYRPRGDGVEQSFFLQRPVSGQGDLTFSCELSLDGLTALPARAERRGGISFVDATGRLAVRYGQIVVRDAAQRGLVLEPVLENGKRITFAVPAKWLDEASYPVVVDPLVGTDFQISPDNPVGVAPPLVCAGTNSFLVVWNDYGAGAKLPQLLASIVSQSGIVSSAFPISSATGVPLDIRFQRQQAAFDGSNWLVVWSDDRAVGPGIRASIISTTGEILGGTDFLIAATSGTVTEDPLVTFNGIDYVVSWQSTPPNATGGSQVFYVRVTTAGVLEQYTHVVPASSPTINQSLLFLSPQQPSGDTLLLYRDNMDSPAQTRSVRIAIDGSLRDSGGTTLFMEEQADGGYGRPIGVAYVGQEWNILSSYDQTGNSEVFLHKFNSSGVITPPQGVFAVMGLGPTGTTLDQYAPVFAGANEWLFVRNEKINGSVYHLLGKRVTFAGVDQDPIPFQIDTATQGVLRNAVAAQAGSFFLVAWLDGRRSVTQPADSKNIFGAVVDATAAATTGTPLVASVAASPTSGEAPLDVSFDASASTGSYDTLSWDFSDGTTATQAQITHTYHNKGTFAAVLKLTKGAYTVYDTAIIVVGGGSNNGPSGATIVGMPVEGSPGMQSALFIQSLTVKLDFTATGKDSMFVNGVVDAAQLPANLTGLLGSVSIGTASTSFNLDATGQAKTSTVKFALDKVGGGFAFAVVDADFRSALAAVGANDANVKPAIQVNIPVTVMLDKFAATATVGAMYKATVDITGVANYGFMGTGHEVSGAFVISSFSALEQKQEATGLKVHTFQIKGVCKKSNDGKFKRGATGEFLITIGNFTVPLPVGQLQDKNGVWVYRARKGIYGLKRFMLDQNSGNFSIYMLKVPADVAGGSGMPLAKSGENIVKVDLNLSLQFDLADNEKFAAGRYMFIERKDAASKTWKLR
ncbi:MAG TPA: PKD domain-containing protein [Planctomycetota bacterium]